MRVPGDQFDAAGEETHCRVLLYKANIKVIFKNII
jgi:hypothetical protein